MLQCIGQSSTAKNDLAPKVNRAYLPTSCKDEHAKHLGQKRKTHSRLLQSRPGPWPSPHYSHMDYGQQREAFSMYMDLYYRDSNQQVSSYFRIHPVRFAFPSLGTSKIKGGKNNKELEHIPFLRLRNLL